MTLPSSPFAPDRRSFLVASSLTALASTRALGANDTPRFGVIGAGQRMGNLLDCAQKCGPHEIAAVAEVYKPRREAIRERKFASPHIALHTDYRAVLDNKDIDAVIVATPDHWHVKIAIDALAAGKDVYLEKPVTHTLEEGDGLVKAVRSGRQILQCGMQQRSWTHFRHAVDIIQRGEIGKVYQVRTYWWQNYQQSSAPGSPKTNVNLADLDWKQWLGNAPEQPFNEERFFLWRWFWNFGGGAMTDLFTHWVDVVHWAMQSDEPSLAFMLGDKYHFKTWDCPDTVQAALRYPAGQAANTSPFDVVYEGMMASGIDDGGLEFRGTEATLKLTRGGFTIYREHTPSNENPIAYEHSPTDGTILHMQNFFDCLRSRQQPNAPVEAGVAAARAGHIANLAFHNNGQTNWPRS